MEDSVIKVENLHKQYRLGVTNRRWLTRDLQSWWASLRGKEDPNSKIDGESWPHDAEPGDVLWALRDVSLEIRSGERVGIIGRNGAGKSTFLKILSRVTAPTRGLIKVRGRIASLLEVGTGFHSELTGRENVYLNGAVLGMKKAEVNKKFDEIVAFAEVERFIDTPVKRYSSGMFVRLAFAVAAHLEPDILVVDEVLAVGDAAFQRKCLGKLEDVSRHDGRTVLFVSHSMPTVLNLCERAILLVSGRVANDGMTKEVVGQYLSSTRSESGEVVFEDAASAPGNELVRLHAVRIFQDGLDVPTLNLDISQQILIEISYWNLKDGLNVYPAIWLRDALGTYVLSSTHHKSISSTADEWSNRPHPVGLFRSVCRIPGNFLNDGEYSITAIVGKNVSDTIVLEDHILSFTVHDTGEMRQEYSGRWIGTVRPKLAWSTEYMGSDPEGSRGTGFPR
jgi:lipopolysaccharide transport system ATP-binding protein